MQGSDGYQSGFLFFSITMIAGILTWRPDLTTMLFSSTEDCELQELDIRLMSERSLHNERIAKKQREADIAAEEAQKIELARLEAQAQETAAEELCRKEAKGKKGKFGSSKAKKEDLKSTGTQAKKNSAVPESKKTKTGQTAKAKPKGSSPKVESTKKDNTKSKQKAPASIKTPLKSALKKPSWRAL